MNLFFITMLAAVTFGAGPITGNSSVDDVLDALDARGKDLKWLTAEMKTSDIDPDVGDVADVRTGRFYYQLLPTGDSRFHALFEKKFVKGRPVDAKHEWSYADGKLIDRDYRTMHQSTTQVLKPGEKMELFRLDGPFPLPLGQDKADVHKHFDVKKLGADKDDPPATATVHLQLTPVGGTELARKFKSIDLWVDPKINMPIRITVVDNSSIKQTDLSNVKPNEAVQDSDFKMQKIDEDKGWQLNDN